MHTVFIEFREKFLEIKSNSYIYNTVLYPSLGELDGLFLSDKAQNRSDILTSKCILDIIKQDNFKVFYNMYNLLSTAGSKLKILDNDYVKSWILLMSCDRTGLLTNQNFTIIANIHPESIGRLYLAMEVLYKKFNFMALDFIQILWDYSSAPHWMSLSLAICALNDHHYFDDERLDRLKFVAESININDSWQVLVNTINDIRKITQGNWEYIAVEKKSSQPSRRITSNICPSEQIKNLEGTIIPMIEGDLTEFTTAFCALYTTKSRFKFRQHLFSKTINLLNTKTQSGKFDYINISTLLCDFRGIISDEHLIKLIKIDNRQPLIDCLSQIHNRLHLNPNDYVDILISNAFEVDNFIEILTLIKLLFVQNDWFSENYKAILLALGQPKSQTLLSFLQWLSATHTLDNKSDIFLAFLTIDITKRNDMFECCQYLQQNGLPEMQLFNHVDNIQLFEHLKNGWDIILRSVKSKKRQKDLVNWWLQSADDARDTLIQYMIFLDSNQKINYTVLTYLQAHQSEILTTQFLQYFNFCKNENYKMQFATYFIEFIESVKTAQDLWFFQYGFELLSNNDIADDLYYRQWIEVLRKCEGACDTYIVYIDCFQKYNLVNIELLANILWFDGLNKELLHVVEGIGSLNDAIKLRDFFVNIDVENSRANLIGLRIILFEILYPQESKLLNRSQLKLISRNSQYKRFFNVLRTLTALGIDMSQCIDLIIRYPYDLVENFVTIYSMMSCQSDEFLQQHYNLLNRLLSKPDEFPDLLTQVHDRFLEISSCDISNKKYLLSFCLRLTPAQMNVFNTYSDVKLKALALILEKLAGVWDNFDQESLPVYDEITDERGGIRFKLRTVVETIDSFSYSNYKQLIFLVLNKEPEKLIAVIDFISNSNFYDKKSLVKSLLVHQTIDQTLKFSDYLSYFLSDNLLSVELFTNIYSRIEFLAQNNVVNNFKKIDVYSSQVRSLFKILFVEQFMTEKFCEILGSEDRVSVLLDGFNIILNIAELCAVSKQVKSWYKLEADEQKSLLMWMRFFDGCQLLSLDLLKCLIYNNMYFILTNVSEEDFNRLKHNLGDRYKESISEVIANLNPGDIIRELETLVSANNARVSTELVAKVGVFSQSPCRPPPPRNQEQITVESLIGL